MEFRADTSQLSQVRVNRVSEALIGRRDEVAMLDEHLTHVEARGAAIVIRGDIGVGKSALLGEAERMGAAHGLETVRIAGTQSEAHITFAGLHQLLRPRLAGIESLPAPQRSALRVALGQMEGDTPDFFHIALATLEMLSDAAATAPLLLIVDDAQWLDIATCDVLMFVARRITSEPIVMLFGVRDVPPIRITRPGLPELEVHPLDQASSELLLDATAPDLEASIRHRVLLEALGNPLALIELPFALESNPDPLRPSVPLTDRLESAFASRILGLSSATRKLLLVAALDTSGDLERLTAAASLMEGAEIGTMEVSSALAAHVIKLDGHGLRFHHPLARSAVYQMAGDSDRRGAHSALAHVYSHEPDRGVWHHAASLVGLSDEVAQKLELLAARAERRGSPDVSVLALERAARLTTDTSQQGRLVLKAARLATELGHSDTSRHLMDSAQQLELAHGDQMMLIYLLECYGQRHTWAGTARIHSLIEIAESQVANGETDQALDMLEILSARCWWGNPDQEVRDRVVAAAERLDVSPDCPKLLAILAQTDPIGQGLIVNERISRLLPDTADPIGMHLVAVAAGSVWAFDLALRFLDPAVAGLRVQGRTSTLAQALVAQAWAAVHLAREPLAVAAADEGARLARETGQVHWAASAQLAMATIEAERGEFDRAEVLVREAEAQLLQIGATPMLALAQFVRGRGKVAHQFFEEGHEHLRRIVDPADPAYNPFIGAWGLSDLVEASVHTDRIDQARTYLTKLQSLSDLTAGPLLRATAGYAQAVIASDEEAEGLFRQAIESDLANWPCYRGRMLLWYGRWLRRQRRVTESRAPLRAALEGFDALGFPELAEIARHELRSTGEKTTQRKPETWTQLSPQELQIAQLAAEGHTNREIAQKLYLSHRTVEYHLYRIFPKLGITRRSQLRDGMSGVLETSAG